MNKTLYINGSFLGSSRISGVQRYGIEITRQLIKHYSRHNKKLIIITNKVYSDSIEKEFSPFLKVYTGNKVIFEQIVLPWISRGNKLLSLANSGPIFHFNHYFVLHDTLIYDFPESFTKKFRIFYKLLWFSISKTAKKFFTVSEFSKNQIIKHLNIKRENVFVASNGYEHLEIIESKGKSTYSDYVLFVGSFTNHKNFDLLVNIFESNPEEYPKLIMAGGFNKKVFDTPEFNSTNITLIENFSDSTLVSLYENCLAVVLPSKFEGFGIPLLECIFFNKPLICSDIEVFKEIGKDYANFFDLNNDEELKRYLKKIKSKDTLPKGDREVILSKYSWEKSSKTIINNL